MKPTLLFVLLLGLSACAAHDGGRRVEAYGTISAGYEATRTF